MAKSQEKSVDAYLKSLPAERRTLSQDVARARAEEPAEGLRGIVRVGLSHVRDPAREVPGHVQQAALCYAGIAAQKNHYAVYLPMCVYQDAKLRAKLQADFAKAGKKLDMVRRDRREAARRVLMETADHQEGKVEHRSRLGM